MKLITFAIGNTEITEYRIPDYIETIGGASFRSSQLTKITIPKNIASIITKTE